MITPLFHEIGLLVQMYGDGVPARGDRNLLGSALASLVDNAIKYAGRGATVEVSAGSGVDGGSVCS